MAAGRRIVADQGTGSVVAHRICVAEATMESLSQLALAGGLGWASGIRMYATILIVGLPGRDGYLHLPGQLLVLQHSWVLIAVGVMTVGEFVADKVPGFDSVWDALHTFIRIPAG